MIKFALEHAKNPVLQPMYSLLYTLFKGLAMMPLKVLYIFSDMITFVLYHVVKYRRDIVRGNLTSAFPKKDTKEIKKIEKEFYRYLGDQIIETIKLLHISDRSLIKHVEVLNYSDVNKTLEAKRNAVILMGHYCNWEWVQEIVRYFTPEAMMVSIYHPLSNKVWDKLFIKLRSRWGAHILPMNKAPRTLLTSSNFPWVCGFIADAWTWQKRDDNRIEFLNHPTWFITGPEDIGAKVDADYFYLEMHQKRRGYYSIILHPLHPQEKNLPYPHIREFWKEFEKTIEAAPAFWLWSHKRWK